MAALAAPAGLVRSPGAEPGRHLDPLGSGQASQFLPQRLGGGDDQAAELVAGLGAGLDRAAAGHLQGPDRFHRAVTGFRLTRRLAVQGGQRGGDCIGGIGLAAPAPRLPVRPDHLRHLDAAGGQVAGQPSPVAPGAFHPDLD
jgi:hypothetical protein